MQMSENKMKHHYQEGALPYVADECLWAQILKCSDRAVGSEV